MAKISITCGILLILIGVGGYFGSGRASVTALIPAFLGLPMAALGALGAGGNEAMRKHTAHVSAVVGVLGFAGSVGGLIKFLRHHLGGAALERPLAVNLQAVTAAVCLVYVVLCIRSFMAARKARAAAAPH